MLKDYFMIAFGSLRKRFLRTSLTMIGIFIGIAAVVSLISLGQGMQTAINQQFAGVGNDKILIQGASAGFSPPGQQTSGTIDDQDLELVRKVPGVDRAAGRILKTVTLEYNDITQILIAASLPEDNDDRDLVIEANSMEANHGRLLRPGDKKKVVVGYNLWAKESFNKEMRLGSKILINEEQYEVIGFLNKIGAGRDDAVLINEEDLRDLTGNKKEYSVIAAQVAKGEKPSDVADRVLRTMRRDRGQKEGFEDITVTTSEELIASINTILGVVQAVFIGIALISLVVGGIGIMNTMYTSVLERTKEIGVMKAIGAKNGDVLTIFLLESALLGFSGGLIGVLLGIGLSKSVELIAQGFVGDVLQASFPPALIIGALLFSSIVGIISGVFPALQASKMQPVDSLRSD